jgi:hypothetical protein
MSHHPSRQVYWDACDVPTVTEPLEQDGATVDNVRHLCAPSSFRRPLRRIDYLTRRVFGAGAHLPRPLKRSQSHRQKDGPQGNALRGKRR